jgi:hypothetical protein
MYSKYYYAQLNEEIPTAEYPLLAHSFPFLVVLLTA